MKKLLTTLLFAGLAFTAQSQQTQFGPYLASIPAGSSNVSGALVIRGTNVSVQIAFALTGAGTAGVAVVVEASNDQLRWCPTVHQFWQAANGTTTVTHMTNFNLSATPFIRLTVHNTNSVTTTNATVSVITKWLRR